MGGRGGGKAGKGERLCASLIPGAVMAGANASGRALQAGLVEGETRKKNDHWLHKFGIVHRAENTVFVRDRKKLVTKTAMKKNWPPDIMCSK